MSRRAAVFVALLVVSAVAFAGAPGGVAASPSTPNKVVDFETIVAGLNTDGSLHRVRLLDDLRIYGSGDVTVIDPSSTEDVRNLLGYRAPDVETDAIRYHVSDLEGSAQFLTVSRPDKAIPLAMAVRYFLDGERHADGKDLVGQTGEVTLRFSVTNTTSKLERLRYKDAAGNRQTTLARVPVPIVAQLQLLLPPDHFTSVEAPRADVVTDPTGNKIVNWNMVMIPPIGDLTQTFTLRAHAEDFRLGPVRLVGAPVAPRSRQFLDYAEEQLAGGVDSATSLYTGAGAIGENLDKLHEGTVKLLDGMEKLFAGSQQLTAGLNKAFSGSGQLTAGLDEAASGSGQLTSGLTKLEDGSNQLTSGLGQAVAGVGRPTDAPTASIAGGLNALKDGLGQILGGLEQLGAGIPQASAQLTGLQTVAKTYGTLLQAAATACAADPDGYCSTVNFTPGVTIQGAITKAANCLSGIGVSDCAPQVPSIATVAGLLAAGLDDAVAGLGSKNNPHSLIGGTAAAIEGVSKLIAGSQTLRSGLEKAYAGSGKISAGLGLAQDGSSQLTTGLRDQAAPGSAELTAGLGKAADGSGQITGGLGKAKGGTSQVESGVYAINELGVKEIGRAANDTAIDIGQSLATLRAQDRRARTESLLYGPPSSDQARTVVGGSGVVLVLDALDGREADTVTRNIYVGIALLLLLGLALLAARRVRGAVA